MLEHIPVCGAGTYKKNLLLSVRGGGDALVTLIQDHEFVILKVTDFKHRVMSADFDWFHLPIVDVSVPDELFDEAWPVVGNRLRNILSNGGKVVLHCRGGLGRT